MEETLTDRQFCETFQIDRATSLRWRELGIVSYVKLPNGGIRYRQKHIEALWANFEKMEKLGVTLKDLYSSLKGGVVHVGVPVGGDGGGMPQNAGDGGQWKAALDEASSASVAKVVKAKIRYARDPFCGCPRTLDGISHSKNTCSWIAARDAEKLSEQARGHKNGS